MCRKVTGPMEHFRKNERLLATPEGRKTVKNFNKMASVLIEYEILYHRGWCKSVESMKAGLNATILVKDPDSGLLAVNFDPMIDELLAESKMFIKFGLKIPDSAYLLCLNESKMYQTMVKD